MGVEALEGRTADCPLSDSDAFIPGTKCAPAHLGDVLVLGLGVSGKSAARYCAALVGTRVDRLFVAAGARNDDSEAFLKSIEGPNVSWDFGDAALEGFTDRFDVCIASPGIPFYHELYVAGQALSNELISEVEFSWRESAADSVWVAITGTNGKTTTTSCAAHILKEAGLAAAAVGNIGDVCLDAVQSGEVDVFVAEVSSYQLYSTRLFAPDVAVMLNITPDHLHWHRTLEAYRDAKFQLLDNMTKRGCQPAVDGATIGKVGAPTCPVAVLDAVNDVVRARVRAYRTMTLAERGFSYIPLGTKAGFQGDMRVACGSDNSAFIDETGVFHIAYQGVEHCAGTVADLQIKGAHNASNALAAAAVAVALGVSDADIARALASFAPLEHRIEPCGTLAGVVCYNDSKATNVDATIKAVESFPGQRVIVLLGGDDKDTELADLVDAVHAHTAATVLFGASRSRFAQAFAQAADGAPAGFAVYEADHMEDALDCALEKAQPGDVVLLSPACASFDEFRSFEHRGRAFKQMVAERKRSQDQSAIAGGQGA